MKVQSTVLSSDIKRKIPVSWSDALIASASFLLGLEAMGQLSLAGCMILIAYFFHRESFKTFLSGLFFLLGSLCISFWNLYFNAVLLCIYILMISFVRLLKGNLYLYFPILCSLCAMIEAAASSQNLLYAFEIMLMSYMLCMHALKTMNPSGNQFRVNHLLFGLILIACTEVFDIFSYNAHLTVFLFVFTLLSQMIDMTSLILLLIASADLFSISSYSLGWMASMIFVNSMKECGKGAQFLGFVLPAALASKRIDVLIYASILFLVSMPLTASKLCTLLEPVHDQQYENRQLASKRRILEHQLMLFSSIFRNISSFFKPKHKPETEFLDGMAQSMELLSMQLKKTAGTFQEESVRIYNLLRGYNYAVNRVDVSETESNQKRIELFLEECSRQDAQEVIVPLLQMMINQSLKMVSYSGAKILKPSVRIELCSAVPMKLKAKTFKLRKLPEASGDTCSLFQYRHYSVCTLSDGMGAGKEAEKSSAFVTQLTQQLLSAGIPVEMAVKSMNSLLTLTKDESFATLDILVFDALSKEAYLSKSGACATFLIRNGKILRILGESLPLGIVEKVEADCYRLNCQPKDIFVMFSDGIEEEQMRGWLMKSENMNLEEAIQRNMEQMNVSDDATVLLAEVLNE